MADRRLPARVEGAICGVCLRPRLCHRTTDVILCGWCTAMYLIERLADAAPRGVRW